MFTAKEQLIIAIIIGLYFLFLFSLSIYVSRKTKTYADYNVAGRKVGVYSLTLTFIGTAIGGSTLLGYMENGFLFGMGQQWINITVAVGVIILYFFLVKKIRFIGEKHQLMTLGDFTALRYGEKARIPTVISVLFYYGAITGMQFLAIGTILHITLNIPLTLGIIIGWLLLTIKTYFGGFKGVVLQDSIHGTVQTVGIVFLFIVVVFASGGIDTMTKNAEIVQEESMLQIMGIAPIDILVFLFTLGFYQCIRQDLWQRIWAANHLKTALKSYAISMIIAVGTGVIVVAIGVFSRFSFQFELQSVYIYYELVGQLFPLPVVIMMLVMLLMTVISCADSFFMSGATSIANDIIRPRLKEFDDQKLLKYSKRSVILVSLLALILVLFVPGLVNLMVIGTAMSISGLLIPVIYGLFKEEVTPRAGVISMWSSLIVACTWQILGHPFNIHPVFVGLTVSLAVFTILNITIKEKSTQGSLHQSA